MFEKITKVENDKKKQSKIKGVHTRMKKLIAKRTNRIEFKPC